eukprot:CAMPEP_0177640190 /NCGR_PEP_ID=MMETSP0447-20121125/6413_1 /TAXON_ID=0 /ORGANISM="Stygamoeba regulata, Strain BSH-02190019" /LENGTH=169 /DNA_ID=CAMNT_0019142249 /DNA_START=187 /DNA_END=696 /DNA_ORIENTATION=+
MSLLAETLKESLTGGVRKARDSFNETVLGEKREKSVWEDIQDAGLKQRAIAFAVCLGSGLLFGLLAFMFLMLLLFVAFGLCYTIANVLLLCSTFFLIGPMRQLRNMVHPVRLGASAIYVMALIVTLLVIFLGWPFFIVLLMVIAQTAALIWYVMSYIPYSRECFMAIVE